MTEEQRTKYGTAMYDRRFLEEHFDDKAEGIRNGKELGVKIKVMTYNFAAVSPGGRLEEQKKEDEERVRKQKEATEKYKGKPVAEDNMHDMFDPQAAFFTAPEEVCCFICDNTIF